MPINNVSGASLSQPHCSQDELVWCSWVPPVRVDSLWEWAVAALGVDGTPWREIWVFADRRRPHRNGGRAVVRRPLHRTRVWNGDRTPEKRQLGCRTPNEERRKSGGSTGRVYAATATQRTRRSSGAKPLLHVARERTKRPYWTGLPSGSILWTSPMFSSRMPGSTLLMSPTMIQTKWLG
jgi:hypothetical protein